VNGERGSITLWMVGMVMIVFAVGGIAIDLWRGVAAHRHVASVVDSAAVAAGSGIDEQRWRVDGVLILDADRVREQVATAGAAHDDAGVFLEVTTAADGSEATVTGRTAVELTLLGLLADGAIEVSARATVSPVLSP
jgi:hypothetical protein